jgi:hypothetical protein
MATSCGLDVSAEAEADRPIRRTPALNFHRAESQARLRPHVITARLITANGTSPPARPKPMATQEQRHRSRIRQHHRQDIPPRDPRVVEHVNNKSNPFSASKLMATPQPGSPRL